MLWTNWVSKPFSPVTVIRRTPGPAQPTSGNTSLSRMWTQHDQHWSGEWGHSGMDAQGGAAHCILHARPAQCLGPEGSFQALCRREILLFLTGNKRFIENQFIMLSHSLLPHCPASCPFHLVPQKHKSGVPPNLTVIRIVCTFINIKKEKKLKIRIILIILPIII